MASQARISATSERAHARSSAALVTREHEGETLALTISKPILPTKSATAVGRAVAGNPIEGQSKANLSRILRRRAPSGAAKAGGLEASVLAPRCELLDIGQRARGAGIALEQRLERGGGVQQELVPPRGTAELEGEGRAGGL